MALSPKLTVLAAMSGGVDSSVAAALLHEEGHPLLGVTLRLVPEPGGRSAFEPCCSLAGAEDARQCAERLGIPHQVINCVEDFQRLVIDDFAREYARGRTPNPCIRCNLDIKFGSLLDVADRLGASHVATGHYVRLEERNGRLALRRAIHIEKDQSYVLAGLTQAQLARSLFPLGGLRKAQVRERAHALGFSTAGKAESQEICFVPDDDYRRFLDERMGPSAPGPIVSTSGETLGRHSGLVRYTVGQRRGLGLAAHRPYYVVRLDAERNAVVVGHEEETYARELVARQVNWGAMPPCHAPLACRAKVRYRHSPAVATACFDGEALTVRFETPQRSIAPGQWVVLYDDDDCVLAAGVIDSFA